MRPATSRPDPESVEFGPDRSAPASWSLRNEPGARSRNGASSRRLTVQVVAAIALLLAAVLVSCAKDPGPVPTLRAFLDGWRTGDLSAVTIESPSGEVLPGDRVLAEIDELAGDLDRRQVAWQSASVPLVEDGVATVTVNLEWTVVADAVWPFETTVLLRQVDGVWRVIFTSSVVHPRLVTGDRLAAEIYAPVRGSIVGVGEQPIVSPRAVVHVGIRAGVDPAALLDVLAQAGVRVDADEVAARVEAAGSDDVVPVATLRSEAYPAISGRLGGLAGVVTREGTAPLAPTDRFGRALLGSVGVVTPQQLEEQPGRYFQGQLVGRSGLQELYEDVLRGRPGLQVSISSDRLAEPDVLYRTEPRTGAVLGTTLDPAVQSAADHALEALPGNAAIVAVRVSDGAVLAVANGPGGGEENLAFTAGPAPGSAFTMISTLALLSSGRINADSPVDCPQVSTVGGRTISNDPGVNLGTVPFHVAFAQGCSTAFATISPSLPGSALSSTAASLGLGTTWNLGVPVTTGEVGAVSSSVDSVLAMLGQARVQASPVSLAAAAATIARGSWRTPVLLSPLPAGAPPAQPGPAGDPPAETVLLPGSAVLTLHDLMREVVTDGTGAALADVPGAPVHAVTGAAGAAPGDADGWTVGWQGDVAFAVFVEGGDAATAVPVAEAFLRGLV